MSAPEEMVYAPAVRGNVAVLVMLAGPSGSGKTKSALRLATGLANGGTIGLCDTEHGRAAYYAEDFKFEHFKLHEPFAPRRFEQAVVTSQAARHAVWICDSFSHEHVGPGGVLDMQEAELQRLTRGKEELRESLKYTSWIAPKQQHKHLVQRLWQLNQHIILCCHAEKKLDLVRNDKGKMVPNPNAGLSPVCAPDIPYAMTASFLLDPLNPGVPYWLKWFDKLEPMVSTRDVLDEATGGRIGAWARGEKPPAAAERPPDKATLLADELVSLFQATASLADHFLIVDEAKRRDQIAWLKRNRRPEFERVNAALQASGLRGQQAQKEQDAAASFVSQGASA